jgi:hypothetical protein
MHDQSTRKIAPRHPVEPRACEICGKIFKPRSNANPGRFCSPDCANAYRASESPLSRFARFVTHDDDPDACWVWHGVQSGYCYGRFWLNGRYEQAHRVAFELAYGPIPDGLWILHTCDNRACVRNDDEGWYEMRGILHPRRGHLWLGTHQDNMDDMTDKGRAPTGEMNGRSLHPESTLRGEEIHNAILTEDDVRAIRLAYTGKYGCLAALGRQYGVHEDTIGAIIRRRNWKWVD